ncbi:MAG: hypothetical protein ACXW2U_08910 [Telluria sp.]
MSIDEILYATLYAVLPNCHSVELPERPTWPAIVFEVESTPELGWVAGGGYDQHDISVVSFAASKLAIVGDNGLKQRIQAALEAIPGFMGDEFAGDADYEGDANVYAYIQNFRIRTRR